MTKRSWTARIAADGQIRRLAPRRRAWFALLAVIAVSLTAAGPAYANSASISFTDAAGNPDPVAGVGRTLTVSGNSSVQDYVFVKYRPTGGAACAPSADSDSGSADLPGYGYDFYDDQVNGNFSLSHAGVWDTPGTFMFCIWIAPYSGATATPITQTVTFREPTATISATVTPASPSPNQTATVTIFGSSEAPEYAYATVRPAGGTSCAPSFDADSGTSMLDDYGVDGSFSTQRTVTESQPGTYLICLWIADWSGGTAIAGPQPETFTVPAPPPPPCVVGTKLVGLALATAEQRLNGSHCTVGAVSSVYSDTVPAGDVITTSPGPGHYPSGQSVAIVVSAGPPVCIAPRLRGLTFRRAKARLRHAHCSVGAVRRPRHVRRGHVLHVRRQSVPAGSRHRDGYPIAITLV